MDSFLLQYLDALILIMPFNNKVVKHTLKILQLLLQNFYFVFDHFVDARPY